MDLPGKGRKSLIKEREEIVKDAIDKLQASASIPTCSTRQVSQLTDISQSSVQRIMRRHLRLYPYHIFFHQQLTTDDKMARHAFANWLLGSPDKIPKILWSDESYFSLNGMINRHNCVIWSEENPSFLHAETLHSPQLCVCGWDSQVSVC